MLAILGGLVAAVCWAVATLASSRSARYIGPWSTLGWVMLIGLLVAAPAVAIAGGGVSLSGRALTLLVVSGVSNVFGLLLAYTALQAGKVAVVAPIISTEGALGALIAVAAGEPLAAGAALVLTVIVVGIILAVSDFGRPSETTAGAVIYLSPLRTALVAMASAACFGLNLYVSGRIGVELPVAWAILPARLAGTIGVAVPLLLLGRLRLTREATPFVVAVALAEVVGTAAFAFGARDGIAIVAVVSSQFGALAAIAGVVLFRERIGRVQAAGVATIAAGVAVLAALRA